MKKKLRKNITYLLGFNRKSRILILLLLISTHGYSQSSTNDLEFIPQRRIYFVGDVHLDNPAFKKDSAYLAQYEFSLKVHKTIYSNLIQHRNVSIILLEIPTCFEYNLRKYLETGNDKHLDRLNILTQQKNNFKVILELINKKMITPENVHCIDLDNIIFSKYLINSLFLLFYYEPFKVKDDLIFDLDDHKFSERFLPTYRTKNFLTDSLNSIKNKLWDLRFNRKKISKKEMKGFFDSINSDSVVSNRVRTHLGGWYNLYVRLSEAFLTGYNQEINNNESVVRESFLAKTVLEFNKTLLEKQSLIAEFGLNHVKSSNKKNLSFIAEKELPDKICRFLLYYPMFNSYYSDSEVTKRTFQYESKMKIAYSFCSELNEFIFKSQTIGMLQ